MKKIKQYKIIEKLGSGGMGEVYKAHDTVLERDVAIKIMHRHLIEDETQDARFMSEAKIIAKSVHPNIVTIHEVGKTNQGRYIVMEFVQGQSVKEIIEKDGCLPKDRALKIAGQILEGLQYAHNLDILHRDIKPDNIIVTENDHVKILDFGIAKIASQKGLTAVGDLLGTVEYMAPEQLLGEPVDHRSDIYAAAVLIYQMLTNHLPFFSDSAAAILYKKLNEDPTPLSFYNPDTPKALDNTILKALHTEKEERWDSASTFAQALDSANKQAKTSVLVHENIKNSIGALESDLTDSAEQNEAPSELLPSVFIGRKKELKQIINMFNQSVQGNGQSVILMGEAGVGKSTLAGRFTDYARVNKALVLYGACLYQDGMDAYLPYIDALRTFFSKDSQKLPDEKRMEVKNIIREKIPLLLEFSERFTTNFGPKNQAEVDSNSNLIEGVFLLLSILSEIQPVILIIDDLQWADEASLRLFHYISRHVSNYRIFLFGISRTDRYDLRQNGKPGLFLELLSRMRRDGTLNQINLYRLEHQLCNQLIDRTITPNLFTDAFYEAVYNETKGNPLFVTETLKQLKKDGTIYQENGSWCNTIKELKIVVPDRVEDIFIRRLSGLNEEEIEILQAASIQGYKFDISLITKVTETPKIKLLKHLQHIEKELQVITSTEQGYQFEHPMMRDTLYNDIPGMLRKEYHLIIAEELEKMYAPHYGAIISDVAQHLMRGGSYEKAMPLLFEAGKRSFDLSAYSEATLFFEDVLKAAESAPAPFDNIPKCEFYFKLGICYEESTQWDKSINAYNKLLKTSEETQYAKGQTDALLRLGRIYGKLGDWPKAISYYNNCLDIAIKESVPNILSRAYNNLGIIYFQKGDYEEAIGYFEKTIASVDSQTGEYDEAHALTNLGIIANIRGQHEKAMGNYKKALVIYQKELVWKQDQARIYHNMGMTFSDLGDFKSAIEAFESCLELSDQVEDKQLNAMTNLNMGKTFIRVNELEKAKELTDKALKIFKRTEDTLNVAEAYHILGNIHDRKNELELAHKYYDNSIQINLELDYHEGLAEAYYSLAGLYYKQSDIGSAIDFYHKSLVLYKKLNIDLKTKEIEKLIDGLATNGSLPVTIVEENDGTVGSVESESLSKINQTN